MTSLGAQMLEMLDGQEVLSDRKGGTGKQKGAATPTAVEEEDVRPTAYDYGLRCRCQTCILWV